LGVVLRRTIITENTKNSGPPKIGGRGRKNVKEKLIRAACAPFVGPRPSGLYHARDCQTRRGQSRKYALLYFSETLPDGFAVAVALIVAGAVLFQLRSSR
jgi:hypothetical protein